MFVLVLIGSGVILFLGIAHAVFTFRSTPDGGPMMPTDPDTRSAMSRVGGLGIARDLESTLFRAWLGFNYSHSLGVILVALFIGVPVALAGSVPISNYWWVACAVVVPWVYLLLSVKYWFSKPTQGIAIAAILVNIGIIGTIVLG